MKRIAGAALARAQALDPTLGAGGKALSLSKDAQAALGESLKTFINYFVAVAQDMAQGHKRKTVQTDDVLEALDVVDMGDLRDELERFVTAQQEAKAAKKEASSAGKTADAGGEGGMSPKRTPTPVADDGDGEDNGQHNGDGESE